VTGNGTNFHSIRSCPFKSDCVRLIYRYDSRGATAPRCATTFAHCSSGRPYRPVIRTQTDFDGQTESC
jgi:hypothetical protein